MQDRQIWTPFSPSAQSKTDPETITTTKDAESDLYLFIGGYRRVFCVCVCVFIREEKKGKGECHERKARCVSRLWVGTEVCGETSWRRTEAGEDAASSQANSRAVILCFAAKVRRIEKKKSTEEHKMIRALGEHQGGGGRSTNRNTNETFVRSDLQHAAPLCSTHDASWTPTLIISRHKQRGIFSW